MHMHTMYVMVIRLPPFIYSMEYMHTMCVMVPVHSTL